MLPLAAETGVEPSAAKVLSDFLASQLAQNGQLRVFGQSDLKALLSEAKDRQSLGCDNAADSCLEEVAGALGAQWLVAGTVGRLGDAPVLSVRSLDAHKHTVIAQGSRVTLREQSELLKAVEDLVPALLAQAQPPEGTGRARQSPVPYVLGRGAIAGLLTLAVAGTIAGLDTAENTSAKNAFLAAPVTNVNQLTGAVSHTPQPGLRSQPSQSSQLPPSYQANPGKFSSTQSNAQMAGAVAIVGLAVPLGFGLGTALTW